MDFASAQPAGRKTRFVCAYVCQVRERNDESVGHDGLHRVGPEQLRLGRRRAALRAFAWLLAGC